MKGGIWYGEMDGVGTPETEVRPLDVRDEWKLLLEVG